MAFVGGLGSTVTSRRRRHNWDPNEVKIVLERDVYFDGDVLRGRVEFDTTIEHLYEGAQVLLLAHWVGTNDKSSTEQTFCYYHQRYSIGNTDTGILIVPPGLKIDKTFSFHIPMHSPCSFKSKEGSVNWVVRFMTIVDVFADTVVTLPFRKCSLYYETPGFTPQARAERIWKAPSLRVLIVTCRISKDSYKSGDVIDITFSAQCSNTDVMPIKKITAKIIQTVYVMNWAECISIMGNRSMKETELAGRDFLLDRAEMRDIKPFVQRDSSGNGVSMVKSFSVVPRVDLQRQCAHQVVSKAIGPGGSGGVALELEDAILAPSMLSRKEIEEEATGDQPSVGPARVHDQIIEVKYEVLVKVKCKSFHNAPMLLSMPFNITTDPDEAATEGLTEEQIQEMTTFALTLDEDLPDYEEIDRLSVPTYSDTESLASVASYGGFSIPRNASSARDLTHLAASTMMSRTSSENHNGGSLANPDSRRSVTSVGGISFSNPGSSRDLQLPRSSSAGNIAGMLSNALHIHDRQEQPRVETGVRRARSRQTSVSERRAPSLTQADMQIVVNSAKAQEAQRS